MTRRLPADQRTRLTGEERRAQILESARHVFLRSGAGGARIQEIADEAGVNPALLYQHFASKEELFEEAVAAPLAAAVGTALAYEVPPAASDPSGTVARERTHEYIVNLLAAMDEAGALLGVVLFSDADAGRSYFQQHIEPLFAQLRALVVETLPAWRHKDFDPDLAVTLVFGMTWYAALEERFRSGPPRDRAAVAEQITAIVFDGLLEG